MEFVRSWQALFRPGASKDYFSTRVVRPFRPAEGRFNAVNAWWLSELSRVIYRRNESEPATGYHVNRPFRSEFLDRVGLAETHFFHSRYAQAALVASTASGPGAFAVLVFRGTSGPLRNWLLNLGAVPASWPAGGMVHLGFKTAFSAVWDAIHPVLEAVDRPLFYTGHSLGGALATLAASLHAPRAVYTFGSPRIGNGDFARSIDTRRVYHVVNRNDLVTQLPPGDDPLSFTHGGRIIYNSTPPPPRSSRLNLPGFLAAHAPLNYSRLIPQFIDQF